jgi:dUTP pyrophosphatase
MSRGKRLYQEDLLKMDGQKVLIFSKKFGEENAVHTVDLNHEWNGEKVERLVDEDDCYFNLRDGISDLEIYELIEGAGNSNKIYFAKVKEGATIPSKELENAGYDIYACFEEDSITILPGEIKLIPTGICSAFSEDFVLVLKERGSTGTKGMSQRCGIIDSGYRNEWFVPINNTSNKTIIISKNVEEVQNHYGKEVVIIYPYAKAISQALLLPVPRTEVVELSAEELRAIPSKRGMGHLGSSGK